MFTEQQAFTSAHLFCGGGDTDGAIRVGLKPLWGIENDRYAAAVFRQRFPDAILIDQMSKPCQVTLFDLSQHLTHRQLACCACSPLTAIVSSATLAT